MRSAYNAPNHRNAYNPGARAIHSDHDDLFYKNYYCSVVFEECVGLTANPAKPGADRYCFVPFSFYYAARYFRDQYTGL